MTETTYPRPLVSPAKRDITVSVNEDGFMAMEWTGDDSDVINLCWVSDDDTARSLLGGTGLCRLGSIFWLMPVMRRKTANKILHTAADLIAEGRIREVSVALARIYLESGDLERRFPSIDAEAPPTPVRN